MSKQSKLLHWIWDEEQRMLIAYSRFHDNGIPFVHRVKHTPKGGFTVHSDSEIALVDASKKKFVSLAGVLGACQEMEDMD